MNDEEQPALLRPPQPAQVDADGPPEGTVEVFQVLEATPESFKAFFPGGGPVVDTVYGWLCVGVQPDHKTGHVVAAFNLFPLTRLARKSSLIGADGKPIVGKA
jgi:hypothetical protein